MFTGKNKHNVCVMRWWLKQTEIEKKNMFNVRRVIIVIIIIIIHFYYCLIKLIVS